MTDLLALIVQQSVNGVYLGCLYVMVALGLTLIYGVLNQINFAHADFVTVGAFAALFTATRLGTTSFTIGTEFRVADNDLLIVTVETVYVLVDAKTLTKLPLPDEIRDALQQGAAGRTTDHAGYQSGN